MENYPRKSPGVNSRWRKIARASAWALLLAIIVEVVSGWGITQTGIIHQFTLGIINRGLADTIHRDIMVPLAVFFLAHVFINAILAISPRHPWNWVIISFIGIIGAGVMAVVVYLQYFRLGG